MLKKIILFLIISLFSLFSLFLIFNISKQNNLSSNSFYNTNQSKDYTPDPYIDYVSDDFNTSDGEDYIFISVYFNDDDYVEDHVEDIQVKFTGIEEPVKYNQHASSANGIAITSNWKYLNNNYVTYKFSYLEPHTVYHMEYISIDDDPDTWTSVDTTFSYIEDDYIESINLVDDKTTSSSVQIKVRFVYPFVTSIPPTTTHEEDLEIQLEGYTTTLTLTHSINDITLTYDGEDSSYTKNKNNKEMYYEQYCLYTISGLRANDTYEITKASIDGEEFTYFDLSFTTKPVEATVDSIQVVDDSITDSSVQIKVTTSTTNFDENNLVLHLEGHDGDLTTSTPVDGITLTHDSTNETEIIYTISGLESNTEYTITSAKLNGISTNNIDLSFTTLISPAEVTNIEVINESITDSSAQIKVTTSTTRFDIDDLVLYLDGYSNGLTTSTPIDGITLTHDSTNETEIYYTISGLESNTEYTITSAELNGISTNDIDLSFTTLITPAEVTNIEIVDDSVTNSSVQIKVTTSTTRFDVDDLVLHLEGHDGGLTTLTPIDGITLTHDSTNETEIYYTISGLESNTEYTITSAELNGISTNDIDLSFTTLITPAEVTNIEIVDDSVTNSSVQIKVTTSTTRFDVDDLVLHLEGHDGGLTTSTPIDGITLTHDSTDETEIIYTISGLTQNTQYTITSAELNGISKNNIDLSFTTLISLAEVTNIEIVNGTITDSSVQIKVTTSTTNFNADDLALHLSGYDDDLTTSNPIDGITLTYDSTDETEIIYTISGLDSNTQYTITSAELNDISTNDIDLSFTTLETPATVNSIEIIDESITDSSAQIKVTTSTTRFDVDDLVLHLEGHDGDLTTSNPVDGITLTHDSTNETEIYYTISGLTQNTQYTITSAELNGTETTVDVSFTTEITLAVINSIELVDDSITDSSAQIKVTTSTTNFNADDLVLHLEGHDGDLTTSNPIDGITLTHDSTNETEIYYTISGLTQNTQYTITSAKLNGISTNNIDLSFTTLISPAEVTNIEIVDGTITDSSVQIKVTTSTTRFDVDDLVLHLEGHDGDLTTSTPINGITLTHDSTDEIEIIYTISGLAQETQYTITSAELNGTETTVDVSFTTAISLAIINTVEVVSDSITDSSAQIKVTTSTTNFNADNLILHLAGHDGDLTTSTPVDEITLTHDSTNETEIIYTISGLAQNTQYTITSVELNGTETTVDVSFTTGITFAVVNSIELVDDSVTDSSAQIKVTTSTTRFDVDDLVLHLEGHDGDLMTSTPVDGITLTYDSLDETEIIYTISGLAQNTQYTITSAELNGISTNDIDLSFTTLETPAIVNSIEIIDESITDSSAQIKVVTSTTSFDENDLILHLDGHNGDLTTSTPVDGITLTYDSINETEIIYTISGLESNTKYTITSAELNSVTTTINKSFTTLISPAEVTNIEIVDDSITNSSVQIKVTTSTTSFDENDLVLYLDGYSNGLTTSTPVDGITLEYDSTNETEIIYTISGLAQNTQYTITSVELNGTETTVDVSFTTGITFAVVNSIELVDDSVTDSSAQIKVTTSTTRFDVDDLVLHLEGHDGDLMTSTPVDGITLTYDSLDETEIIYTISGLAQNTQYTITSAELNGISTNDIDLSFTTLETPAIVNSIEIIDESITDSSAQIKVVTSTTSFDENDLILHLDGHNGDLTTSTPVDGITLTYDSINETEIIYTISGLESNTKYTITSAELNSVTTTINKSFTTLISPAEVTNIEIVDDSITNSSVQIKVTTSTTSFDENDLVLYLDGYSNGLTTSTPVDGITLEYDSTNRTEIYYTISGLEPEITYKIISIELNNTVMNTNISFTTSDILIEELSFVNNLAEEDSIEIKIKTSHENFDVNNLAFHLDGYGDQLLTTSTSIDDITLTYNNDKVNNTATYTISGLEEGNIYEITDASIDNDHSTWVEFDLTIDLSNLDLFMVITTIIILLLILLFIIYLLI